MKFGFVWSWVFFKKKSFENIGHIHVYNPGAGADNPHWVNYFSLTHLFSQFSPLMQVLPHWMTFNSFPHSNV